MRRSANGPPDPGNARAADAANVHGPSENSSSIASKSDLGTLPNSAESDKDNCRARKEYRPEQLSLFGSEETECQAKRTRAALSRAGISVRDLRRMDREDAKQLRGVGKGGWCEIALRLARRR
jgi:hypothetical protein